MTSELEVRLGDVLVGRLLNLPGDDNLFAFDDAYAADPDRSVLGQAFVDRRGDLRRSIPRVHTVATPFFANLLPERDGALRTLVARQNGLNLSRDFPLLAALGRDLPGAVIVSGESPKPRRVDGDEASGGSARAPLRFSLVGVQTAPRVAAAESRSRSPASVIPGSSSCRRTRIRPRVVYAIRRFDRHAGGGRTHFEDLNQIADQFPFVFGLAVGNGDMHLKNWAIMYPHRGAARLAPLYDFVATGVYLVRQELTLPIDGEKRFARITEERLVRLAAAGGLGARRARSVVRETVDRFRDAWFARRGEAADSAVVSAIDRQLDSVPALGSRGRLAGSG